MTREEVFRWAEERFGVVPDYPWMDCNAVLRHSTSKKWFAVVLNVGRDKLGLPGTEQIDVLNVKCDPRLAGTLRTQNGYHPAYHMNKEQWLTIRLDGSVPREEIENLLDLSWELTRPKVKANKQRRPKESE